MASPLELDPNPNPNPNPRASPSPSPNPNPTSSKPSSARKLPIKRKNPPPFPSPSPSPLPSSSSFDDDDDDDAAAAAAPGVDEDDVDEEEEEEDEEEDEEEEDEDDDNSRSAPAPAPAPPRQQQQQQTPPFKFHRIWSEPDELRFLQGLLGCWSQGLVFPRDLNLFYDQFSESMPQPYTRSQLSEKLRRLRKKFRTMSARVARGHDPSRLAPHDRDLLHLCTRLWHPSYAASSPFSAPDLVAPGSGGNKRRRPNPRPPSSRAPGPAPADTPIPPPPPPINTPDPAATATTTATNTTPLPLPAPPATAQHEEKPRITVDTHPVTVKEEPLQVNEAGGAAEDGQERVLARAILDVFEECLKELRPDGDSGSRADESDLVRRWKVQRLAEMDAMARRMRLVLEDSAGR